MRWIRNIGRAFAFLIAGFLFSGADALAAISYTGGNYTQDFNGLPMTGSATLLTRGPHGINGVLGTTNLADWTMSNYEGSSTSTEFRAQDGAQSGSAGRGVVSFGTNASGERALGVLATSNQISRFGTSLVNNTGATINAVSLAYTGEQWRRGDPDTHNVITFAYSLSAADINAAGFTDVAALSFNSPNVLASPNNTALDGNLAANRVAVSGSVFNLNWTSGTTLTLRWSGFDVGGQDDGLAVDDLTFVAVPEPVSWVLGLIAALAAMLVRRR